jgi:hypothetical protein
LWLRYTRLTSVTSLRKMSRQCFLLAHDSH